MTAARNVAVLALALTAGSAVAGAQGKCDIDVGKPFQVNSAKIYYGKAAGGGKPDERHKHMRDAVRVLTERADKIGNPAGRNWMLGKTLILWTQQEGVPAVGPRKMYGYTENPDATVDVLVAADSALTAVEQAMPQCADSVSFYRRLAWVPIINSATQLVNAGQVDSAAKLAERSLMILREGPNAYYILSNVAQQKNDVPKQLEYLQKTVDAASSDTSFKKIRQQSMFNIAVLVQNQAASAEGAERDRLNKRAIELYRGYLQENPSDANAQAYLARALAASGDTASVASIYAEMLANPTKFTDIQLFEAGVTALSAEKFQEATQLIESGLKLNPYYRDALFNLANAYFRMNDAQRMQPVLKRLVEVDPDNPDNWRLYAGYYQLLEKAEKNAARKKALTDTLIKSIELFQKMPVKVSFSGFTHQGATHTLTGQVENLGDAAKSFELKFEFLDKSGQVVATQTANVGTVAPKESKPFTVSVNQSGIASYRYASVR